MKKKVPSTKAQRQRRFKAELRKRKDKRKSRGIPEKNKKGFNSINSWWYGS